MIFFVQIHSCFGYLPVDFMWNTPWYSLCISRIPTNICTGWRDKRRKSWTFSEKCKKCRELKCPWWLFWRLMGGSGKPGLLVLSQPSPCSRIFPYCQQLQWQEGLRKAGLLPEPTATPRAPPPAQSIPSLICNPVSHAGWKIFQGLALFAFLNAYTDWEGRDILL